MLLTTKSWTTLLTYAKLRPTQENYTTTHITTQLEQAIEQIRTVLLIKPTKKSQFIHDVLGDYRFDVLNTCSFVDPWYATNWWDDEPQNYINFLILALRDLPSHIRAICDCYERNKEEIDKFNLDEINDVSADYYASELGPSIC